MKNIATFIISLIILLGLTLSCNKNDEGKIKVLLTDDPADFTEVNVNIIEVWAHYDGDWVQLDANTGIYDLLELQNGVTDVLADPTAIPAGKVNQVRLILGEGNYAVEEDSITSTTTQHPLELSSQDKTGIKINLNSEVVSNQTMVVTLDFDAGSSIVETGNGQYKLKPVIKVEEVIYI
ncbi:DUF4382 domain-containing protein [Brumimicrobium aurantiacum]|uniref:DUF4382 domain-containing protein n=1 Tax=Brumimicrobium aurantiacum TaxID=1737063 RepID=A0A3E1EWB3_9FLAO|nr:DUF4382 domain-containing protein [Brumimicrobium aurantiacum]RFC53845.1 DUF4382 domain-containing protein [Brumimicrobium aurantiacum]